MRESLRLKKKELTELKNDCEREKQEILNLEKSSDHLKESIQQTKDLFDATYKKNVQVFSQKAKFRETLENEHELNKKTHQQKEIERKIKELKCDLANIEKEEANSAEEQKRTDYQNFMEEEYLKVKAEGVSNKPKKLSAEFEELQIKKENLDKDKDQSIEKIQALSAEWQKLNNELNEIVLNHEADRKINHREFERIELSLKEKNKQMNESEKILNNLEFIISSICGSVSRIGVMLDEEKTYVKPRQLKKHFDYFIIGIESRLKFITQQVFSEEKIRELSFKFPNFVSIYCKNKTSEDSDLWQ
jgi:chromosome segregation ATPase